jgi:hypothetical protein
MITHVLTIPELLNIEYYPMIVLSDNIRSFVSWGIKAHQHGNYNHLMWLISPDTVATQDWLFRKQSLSKFFKTHRLKFWYNPIWTKEDKSKIIGAIEHELNKSAYMRHYDCLAIVGQLLHMEWLQIPWIDICSDKANYLKVADKRYNLKNPSPPDVNRWLEKNKEYSVYGRYIPD